MAETRQVYKFDRFRNGKKMAEGATITRCTNPEDAAKEAARLFGNHPYERFVLRPAETRWKVTLEQETDGRWIAEVESVTGALAYGESKEEAAIKAAEIARSAEPSPQEFYEANATNVCNVPRVGHPEDPSGWAGVRRASEARFVAGDALVMTLADAFDFAEKYKGMADNQDSPLMRLREKIAEGSDEAN